MGFALALFGLVFYSSNLLVTKIATRTVDVDLGVSVAAMSNVVFGLVFLGVQVAWKGSPARMEPWAVAFFLASGVFSTYLGRWFFYTTVARLGPARASAFQITGPIFTVLVAWAALGERPRLLDAVSVAVTLTGLFLVSYVSEPGARAPKVGSAWSRALGAGRWTLIQSGALVALLSSCSYAVANVLRGAGVRRWNEPILGGVLGAAVGMVVQVAASSRRGNVWREVATSDRRGVALYGLTGLLTICAQVCLIAAMTYIPVGLANLITMSTPILVTPASYFLLKNQEGLRARTVLGIAVVVLGMSTLALR